DREVAAVRTKSGHLEIHERAVRPVMDVLEWEPDGPLRIAGELPSRAELPAGLVLRAGGRVEERVFPLTRDDGRFEAELDPWRVRSLAGTLPLPKGRYQMYLRLTRDGGTRDAPIQVGNALRPLFPLTRTRDGRTLHMDVTKELTPLLRVNGDLTPEERSRKGQRLLTERVYPELCEQPLRPQVFFESYYGRQYSDSPRAILEELRRRDAGLEFVWSVRDGQVELPEGITPVRRGGREYVEALACSKYVVVNSHLPWWFRRRPGQTVLQTWHGATLKRIGFDIERVRFATRDYHERLALEVEQWDYLVSPSPWCTPIMRRAFRFEGEVLETGYPRNDLFFAEDRDEIARAVRQRIGVPEGRKVILYAPTWRDDKFYTRGRYRLDLKLDLRRMQAELGEDHVVLVRRHPHIVDRVPEVGRDFVFDVSVYPQMQELLLITDVLVTDYSSVMFDFAITRRPMLFFTYDLESYRDELRGFYFDFESDAPGPLLRTGDEVIAALRDIDRVVEEHADAYRAFTDRHCALDDGKATARVVDRVFG
ncbi:MAG: CDP-glycerol glycerophosphotransferase family protein, partial [Actinomadura rubrobrunea]|nr:CDP-glycerol glycerophosphotransferase family protein [Actinomadura rubrobrunea]